MYTNYAYGVENGLAGATGSTYNLLITGATDYTGSSGMMLKNNTGLGATGNKGTRIAQDSLDNSYLDFRTTATDGSNSLSFRMMDDTNTASVNNLLVLNKDGLSSTSVYGAKVGGRVKASQYYVGQADTRTPSVAGVYVGQDNSTIGYFKINKGTGTGGYNFVTTDANGLNPITNLSLKSTGVAQIPYYSQTTNAQDTETTAMAMWDMQGNVIRGYNSNQRVRALEAGLTTLENNNYNNVPTKVNEVVGRLNTLKIWNTSISQLQFSALPTPAPTLTQTAYLNGGVSTVYSGTGTLTTTSGNYNTTFNSNPKLADWGWPSLITCLPNGTVIVIDSSNMYTITGPTTATQVISTGILPNTTSNSICYNSTNNMIYYLDNNKLAAVNATTYAVNKYTVSGLGSYTYFSPKATYGTTIVGFDYSSSSIPIHSCSTSSPGTCSVYSAGPSTGGSYTQDNLTALCFDSSGNLYVGIYDAIYKVPIGGGLGVLWAGTAGTTGSTNGTKLSAKFNFITELCFDSYGNMFVCDRGNSLIRKIDTSGNVTTFASGFSGIKCLCISSSNIMFCKSGGADNNNIIEIA